MWPNPQDTADMVTFTLEILKGKLCFCAVSQQDFSPATLVGILYTYVFFITTWGSKVKEDNFKTLLEDK